MLEGRIVTMDDRFQVLARGRVYAHHGDLVAVQDAGAPAPAGFGNTAVTDTGGTIYPGLIDLHNHLPYNVLPLWQVPKKFGNRGQWGRHAEYQSKISAPMQTLAATPELLASICRYVEVKSLIGGTTTGQGITLANQSGIRRYFRGVLRNVEATDDDTLPAASTRVPDVAASDAQAFLARLKKEKTCYLLHLAEGLDATARRAFASLQIAPGQWAITSSLCGIHAAALQAPDFEVLAAHGGSMVWSPFSNLLLYGGTADVAAAKAAGVPIALGCDWAPSGSRNLLNELKVAWLLSEAAAIFTPRELVALVTREAAKLLDWEGAVGTLAAGRRADLLVAEGMTDDPYLQFLRARESDLSLVMINGIGRFGDEVLMRSLAFAREALQVGGAKRMLSLAHPAADPLVQGLTLAAARDALQQALRGLPALARRAERPQAISPAAMAAGAGNTSRLALDELLDTGVDLRVQLPAPGAEGRTMRAAMMRAVFAAAPLACSEAVAPLSIDPLTVVDDPDYFDALDAPKNVPALIKAGLRDLWLRTPPPTSLRDALVDFTIGWRDDLSPTWQDALAGVEPAPAAVAATLRHDEAQPIYPSRRGKPLPGARADAHVFRAFDDLEPSQVRCVLIGQDPYPVLSRATGRSFEQGDLDAWDLPARSVASSLRVLLRMLFAARTGDPAVIKMSWAAFARHLVAQPTELEAPRVLFDRLQQTEGVLFLNAGLTLARYRSGGAPEQTRGHIPFWRPVVGQVLRSLATRDAGQVVFLCLGQSAQKLLASEGVKTAAAQARTWHTRAGEVALLHPVAPGFISGPNPFDAVNAKLASFGGAPIAW